MDIKPIEAKRDILYTNPKIQVRRSSIHGYGVFAREFIEKGEVLEECHLLEIADWAVGPDVIGPYVHNYPQVFDQSVANWLPPDCTDAKNINKDAMRVIPTGFATMYNSAKDIYTTNVRTETIDNLLIIIAKRDIEKDQECLQRYDLDFEGSEYEDWK